jgi:hypothetical protein
MHVPFKGKPIVSSAHMIGWKYLVHLDTRHYDGGGP